MRFHSNRTYYHKIIESVYVIGFTNANMDSVRFYQACEHSYSASKSFYLNTWVKEKNQALKGIIFLIGPQKRSDLITI